MFLTVDAYTIVSVTRLLLLGHGLLKVATARNNEVCDSDQNQKPNQ